MRFTTFPNATHSRIDIQMLLDPMGSVVITNDGNCILREIDVSHPTAKSMIELSRAQDEEVGDGTTSVIILAGEMLVMSEPFLRVHSMHPTVIVQGYNRALQEALLICDQLALVVDIKNQDKMKQLVQSCIGTKFSSRWNDKMVDMALQAVLTVARPSGTNALTQMEVDLKRYAKVEKIPGGEISDCTVLKGVMFNKDTTHSKMRRKIVNPRILLLDSPLEYKKGESQTNVEITDENDWNTMLRMEEDYVEHMCMEIIAAKPDIVITEKGVSDLAQHYLAKADITTFRRLRKTDNNRVARATGATIVSRTELKTNKAQSLIIKEFSSVNIPKVNLELSLPPVSSTVDEVYYFSQYIHVSYLSSFFITNCTVKVITKKRITE